MGCGCRGGGNAPVAGQWVHTAPGGDEEAYATEWEARAAAARSGGTYQWRTAERG